MDTSGQICSLDWLIAKCKLIDTWYFISYLKAEYDAHDLKPEVGCNEICIIQLWSHWTRSVASCVAMQRIMSHFEALLLSGCQAVYQ